MKFGDFSVKNPVLINILMVAVLVLGGISLKRMPQEQFSEVPFYFAFISVPWPGVSAEEVERQIIIPLEEEMQGLDDLDEISSVSIEGLGVLSISFDEGISNSRFSKLLQDVNTQFANVELPEGTLHAQVEDFSSADFAPVIEVVVSGDVAYAQLIETAELLEERIRRLPQVSGVNIIGSQDKRVLVEVNRPRLEAGGHSLSELVQVLQGKNINVPGGVLRTRSREYLVRTAGEVKETQDFGDVVVRQGREGEGFTQIKDLASIREEYDPYGNRARLNGQASITLRVTKIPKGSSVDITEGVKALLEEWRPRIPEDILLVELNDSSVPIRSSISTLMKNALFGLVLVVGVLYLFVGLRNAVMTALGIPVTFALTFLVLESMGQTFNSNTLFGLVLVLGLIVDHAIVIIENSYRLQHEGVGERHLAAMQGANQVAVPVIAGTLTTIAAFLPLMILPGTIGKFLRTIPLTVSVALVASTCEALFILPSHYADWPGGKKRREDGRLWKAFRGAFEGFLHRVYRRRKLVVILFLLMMLSSFGLLSFLQQDLFSAEDLSIFYVDITMPPGTPLDRTDELTARYEERLLPLVGKGEISAISSSVGFRAEFDGNVNGPNVAQIAVDLVEREDRQRLLDPILQEAQELTQDIPGAERVIFRKAVSGPPTDKPVSFRLYGNNYDELTLVSERIRGELAKEPELLNIEDNYEPGAPELTVRVNEERAAAYGLSVFQIGQYLRASVSGIEATRFFRDNKEIDVIVQFEEAGTMAPSVLEQLVITTLDGRKIPFSAVARVESGESLASIKRLDGRREITITSDAFSKENIPAINKKIVGIFEEEFAQRFPELELTVGGEFTEFNNLLVRILRLFLVGIFVIYIILGAQFKSYTQPFLIMFSVPMAFAGVLIYLVVSGTAFSIVVLYAGVALAGIAVNDAIVLISFINQERRQGAAPEAAVRTAAVTRLRPILLTSLTTIGGLLPTALGLGGTSFVWQPMANTIIFGLLFSTIATLIFIPALYGNLYDRHPRKGREKKKRKKGTKELTE